LNNLKTLETSVFTDHVKVKKTGLIISNNITFEEWEKVGNILHDIIGALNWWAGDWILYGEGNFADKWTQVLDKTGYEKKTINNAMWVCGKIPFSRRREKLSYGHHSEVAPFDTKETQDKWLDKAETEGWSVQELREAIRNDKKNKERGEAISDLDLREGDFKTVLDNLVNIDAIITDPPYPKEFIQCFSDLSKYASEHLKDDGFLVCYSGQYNLLEVINRLSEHLTYVWIFCLYHVGKSQIVNGVNIMCGWKPILIFSKGKKKMSFSAYDVVISEESEKFSHEWQQSESGVEKLIEIFTKPNELIVDPFAGSGTFLKVANDMGRRGIGAELNVL